MNTSRRTLLAALAAGAGGLAGCFAIPSTGDELPPSTPAVTPSTATPPDPCRRAFEGPVPDRDCGRARFEDVGTVPASTATTAPGETPYEGTVDDHLRVRLRTNGESTFELRGCVEGTVDGSERHRSVARTLPDGRTDHELRVGPFDHPGGIDRYHLWLRDCDAAVRDSL